MNENYSYTLGGLFAETLTAEDLSGYGITGTGVITTYTVNAVIGAIWDESNVPFLDCVNNINYNILIIPDAVIGENYFVQYLY